MDVSEFKQTAGWLAQTGVSDRMDESRRELAGYLGLDNEGYARDEDLEALFWFIHRNRPELLDELAVADGDDKREEWIAAVAVLANPAPRYQLGAYDDGYGMWYRYDTVTEVYEWAESGPDKPPDESDAWMSQQEADAVAVGRAQQAAVQGEEEGEEFSLPAWDENWQMLYRLGPGGVYQYAYSDDQQTIRPGARWLTYDEVLEEARLSTAEQAPAPAEAAQSGVTESAATTPEAAVAQVVDEIVPDALAELAEEIPEVRQLTPEQLQLLIGRVMSNLAAAVPAGSPPGQQ